MVAAIICLKGEWNEQHWRRGGADGRGFCGDSSVSSGGGGNYQLLSTSSASTMLNKTRIWCVVQLHWRIGRWPHTRSQSARANRSWGRGRLWRWRVGWGVRVGGYNRLRGLKVTTARAVGNNSVLKYVAGGGQRRGWKGRGCRLPHRARVHANQAVARKDRLWSQCGCILAECNVRIRATGKLIRLRVSKS